MSALMTGEQVKSVLLSSVSSIRFEIQASEAGLQTGSRCLCLKFRGTPSSLSNNSVTTSYFRHVLMKNILHHTHFDSEITLLKSVQQSGKPGLEH